MRYVPVTKEDREKMIQKWLRNNELEERNELFNRLSYEEIKTFYDRLKFLTTVIDDDLWSKEFKHISEETGLKYMGLFEIDCERRFPNIEKELTNTFG